MVFLKYMPASLGYKREVKFEENINTKTRKNKVKHHFLNLKLYSINMKHRTLLTALFGLVALFICPTNVCYFNI